MFYLTDFFQIIFKRPIVGVAFVIGSLALILMVAHNQRLKANLADLIPHEKEQGEYFYALISNKENISWVGRKVRGLPGVSRVSTISLEEIERLTRDMIEDLRIDLSPELMKELNYAGIRVDFEAQISSDSKTLIRNYLVRLTGEDKISLGGINRVEQVRGIASDMVSWLHWGVIALCNTVWLLLFWSLSKTIKERAYFIESFQRRTHVFFKITFTGMLVLYLVGGMLSFGYSAPWIQGIIFVGLYFFIIAIIRPKRYLWHGR